MEKDEKKLQSVELSSKRLVDQLTEAALSRKLIAAKIPKKNLALFLSKKDEINEAMAAGWSRKNIWELLHSQKAFEGCYDCFLRYVRKYIDLSEPMPADGPIAPTKSVTTVRPSLQANTPSGFDFSPTFQPSEIYGEEEAGKAKQANTVKSPPHKL